LGVSSGGFFFLTLSSFLSLGWHAKVLPFVSGIGVQLHFNFQFFLIVWALAIGVAWLFLALSVDDALLILATKPGRGCFPTSGKIVPSASQKLCKRWDLPSDAPEGYVGAENIHHLPLTKRYHAIASKFATHIPSYPYIIYKRVVRDGTFPNLMSLAVLNRATTLGFWGTRRAKTARQNCILVAWGFETQMRLMWTKIDFVVAVPWFAR